MNVPPTSSPPPYFGLNNPPGISSPDGSPAAPSVVTWFRVYAGFMALVYLALFSLGIFLVLLPVYSPSGLHPPDSFLGIIYAVMGFVLAIPFAVGVALRPARWVWTYNLVLICFGMLSACSWPITIPLLIYWINAETKAYYGA
jgi:hypothetical protein